MKVKCEICGKDFPLTSVDDIVELRTMDTYGVEVAERQEVFGCPECVSRYVVYIEEEGEE